MLYNCNSIKVLPAKGGKDSEVGQWAACLKDSTSLHLDVAEMQMWPGGTNNQLFTRDQKPRQFDCSKSDVREGC